MGIEDKRDPKGAWCYVPRGACTLKKKAGYGGYGRVHEGAVKLWELVFFSFCFCLILIPVQCPLLLLLFYLHICTHTHIYILYTHTHVYALSATNSSMDRIQNQNMFGGLSNTAGKELAD